MILLSFFSQRDNALSTFSMCAGLAAFPKSPRLKLTAFQTVSKESVESSWGTSPMSEREAR